MIREQVYRIVILSLSILIPLIVAILFYMPKPDVTVGFDIKILPAFHAFLNSCTSVILAAGFLFIKKQNKKAHKICMISATLLSVIFLLSYVTYHSLSEPTIFDGEGLIKGIYYFVLITHIILAALIVPLVLFSVYFGLTGNFKSHRKISKWTFPLWLYVAVSGVVVYFMIAPYY